jgi:hypothetical protein
MNSIKIFLASSEELKADRDQFEINLSRENKKWRLKNIFLDLIKWEDFFDAVSATGLQDEYNQSIKNADIFIMLFHTKVGKRTEEEFQVAFKQFKEKKKPYLYVYFKDTGKDQKKENSVIDFFKKLDVLRHDVTRYDNTDRLFLHFINQLDKLYEKDHFLLLKNIRELLKIEEYEQSIRLLKNMKEDRPLDPLVNYYLAISLLKGRPPQILRPSEAESICRHLETACNSDDPKAHYFCLWAFVKNDFHASNGIRIQEPYIEDILNAAKQYPLDAEAASEMSIFTKIDFDIIHYLYEYS